MKKILCFFLILAGAFTVSAQNIKISGTAPQFTGAGAVLNPELNNAFNEILNELRDNIGSINAKPEDLIQGFGNSSVFASHGATHRSYAGYDFLAITAGAMFGVQLPKESNFDKINDNLQEKGDIAFGVNPQLFNINFGINTSKFLVKNLYLGARLGFLNIDDMDILDGFSFKTFQFGITANYQILPKLNLGVVEWRGINLGTGVIYQSTKLNFSMPIDEITETVDSTLGINLTLDPRLTLNMEITTFTIPLEVMTSVKLLVFNFPFGLGVDLAFGSSDIRFGVESDMYITGPYSDSVTPGSISVMGGGKMSPNFINPKLMTGFGFKFGPVVLDFPLTYYFAKNGFNVGITIGAVL